MEFKSVYGVRFKVFDQGADRYLVKYYTETSKWPKQYRPFRCSNDEARREMFYILGQSRPCTTCKDELLGYKDDPQATVCKTCQLNELARQGVPGDSLAECPVCYQKILSVDNTKQKLVCNHEMCTTCLRRIARTSHQPYYDPVYGLTTGLTITCPMCRDVRNYDRSFRPAPL